MRWEGEKDLWNSLSSSHPTHLATVIIAIIASHNNQVSQTQDTEYRPSGPVTNVWNLRCYRFDHVSGNRDIIIGQVWCSQHAIADWLTTCDVMTARRMRVATQCWRLVTQWTSSQSPASAASESAWDYHQAGAMSREQHCLVYSIDAILGLTGNGQRSSSTTVGRRKCRESNDAFELQRNTAASQNGPPGIMTRVT